MHVQNMGLRTLNGSHGVQQRSTNLESLVGNIGETVVQNVHLNQVSMQLYAIMGIFSAMNNFKIYFTLI